MAHDFGFLFQSHTEAKGDRDRTFILGMDQADQARMPLAGEGVGQDRLCRLGGVAAAPKLAPKCPADFQARPSFGLPATDPTGHESGRTFLHGPQAESA